jgi:hypothetical protein
LVRKTNFCNFTTVVLDVRRASAHKPQPLNTLVLLEECVNFLVKTWIMNLLSREICRIFHSVRNEDVMIKGLEKILNIPRIGTCIQDYLHTGWDFKKVQLVCIGA